MIEIENTDRLIIKYGIIFGCLIIAFLLLSPVYSVGAGERGVIFNSIEGGIKPNSIGEGIHFKNPIFENVYIINVKAQIYEAEADSASADLQSVKTSIAVNYHLEADKVWLLVQEVGYGYDTKVIRPAIEETVKSSTAKMKAEELITDRQTIKNSIKAELSEKLLKYYIIVDDVSITNFAFSDEFNNAIESKVKATQDALKEKERLQQFTFEAQQKIVQAEGEANSTLMKAKAEAESIMLINEQLTKSPEYVEYIKAQKWNGQLPQVTGASNMIMEFDLFSNGNKFDEK